MTESWPSLPSEEFKIQMILISNLNPSDREDINIFANALQ